MALESATYIDGLNTANPPGNDPVGQADDHIRLIKGTLKATFPNITGPVTVTQQKLNEHVVPIGAILMWSGSAAALPTGWRLCDGGTYSKSDGSGNITAPDLRNKFIQACGGSTGSPTTAPTVGTTGGAATVTPTITVAGHALTKPELPSYNLTVTDPGHIHAVTDPGHSHIKQAFTSNGGTYLGGSVANFGATDSTNAATTGISINTHTTGITVASGGSGSTHNHTATSSAIDNKPPFYTLAFIIKI